MLDCLENVDLARRLPADALAPERVQDDRVLGTKLSSLLEPLIDDLFGDLVTAPGLTLAGKISGVMLAAKRDPAVFRRLVFLSASWMEWSSPSPFHVRWVGKL